MRKVSRLLFPFLAVLILTLSCGKDNSTGPGSDDTTEPVISENAKVVDEEVNLTLDTLTENTLTYTYTGQSPDISTGDILVSTEGDNFLGQTTYTTAA